MATRAAVRLYLAFVGAVARRLYCILMKTDAFELVGCFGN